MLFMLALITINTTIIARHFLRQEYYEKMLVRQYLKPKNDDIHPVNKYEC